MNLARTLESLLFFFAEPKSAKDLAIMLKVSDDEVRKGLDELQSSLSQRGVVLVVANDEYALATAPEASEIIERITREEREKELGKAALETLSIVLYHGPLTRSAIDHIRGVNSTFIVRNLLIRGLVEKVANPEDQRSFLYQASMDLLRFMGVARREDLPDYQATRDALESFMNTVDVASKEGEEPVIHAEDAPPSTPS